MKPQHLKPQTHVFVCTNEKPEGKACCKKVGGQEFFQSLKTWTKENGLSGSVWVTRTGCLGFCNEVGTTVKIIYENGESFLANEVVPDDMSTVHDLIMRK